MLQNNVRLRGRLGKDIEIKAYKEHKIAQISMAIQKNKDDVQWLFVNVWDKQADYLDRYAKKGTMIEISGRIENNLYKDKDGKERRQMQIVAEEVAILSDWKKAEDKIVIEEEELPFY